ncbi:MAG TPA: AraC family transcriptional regulator [Steroidobacteraceae bacterium]
MRGGYVEAGDTGRYRANPGDVLLHRSFEFHLNRFDRGGAEVLVIPVTSEEFTYNIGRIAEPDAIVRLVESAPEQGELVLLRRLLSKTVNALDWPDVLAGTLRQDPSLQLGRWAAEHGLAIGSVSRRFAQVYGVSPATYRLQQRTHRAIRSILAANAPLVTIAQDCGFADQAHMARSVRRATEISASCLLMRARKSIERERGRGAHVGSARLPISKASMLQLVLKTKKSRSCHDDLGAKGALRRHSGCSCQMGGWQFDMLWRKGVREICGNPSCSVVLSRATVDGRRLASC